MPLPRRQVRAHEGRLRVGYLSADFHQHATSQLTVQMFEAHDRSRFDVTLFSAGPDDGTPLRRRMQSAAEHFVDLHGLALPQMAAAIRERDIDILVDVKGATYGSVMQVMAHRPAPLQVNWLGFPGTSGADYIDYLIGDAIVTPLADEAHFSERIAQMPLCYQPNDSRRALPQAQPRSHWGLPGHALVLCGFHQSYKISREVFAQLVPPAAGAARCGAVAAVLERQCAGRAHPRRGGAEHRSGAAGVRAAPAGRRSTCRGWPRPTFFSTPGRATRTPLPARRCGPAYRQSR